MLAPHVVIAVVALVTVQAVFAGYQILGKLVISSGLNPIAFALIREVTSSTVFLIAFRCFVPRSSWPQKDHFLKFFYCGISMFGNVFLNIIALTMTTPSIVALLQPTQPVFASILTACLGHERMSLQKAIGVCLSCLGSAGIAFWQHGVNGGVNFGSFAVLAQCISGANYVVQQRPLLQLGYSPLTVSGCSYAIATVITLITGAIYFLVLPLAERADVEWYQRSVLFVGVMLYCVFLTTVYNYVVMAWATGKLGATLVTLFGLLQGVFASLVEWLVFHHPILLGETVGAITIFIGLVVVVTSPGSAGYVDTRQTWASALSGSATNILDGCDVEQLPERKPSGFM